MSSRDWPWPGSVPVSFTDGMRVPAATGSTATFYAETTSRVGPRDPESGHHVNTELPSAWSGLSQSALVPADVPHRGAISVTFLGVEVAMAGLAAAAWVRIRDERHRQEKPG